MQRLTTGIATFAVIFCAFLLGAPARSGHADGHVEGDHAEEAEGHSHSPASGHGGLVTMTNAKEFHFEVLFLRDSIRMYAYDGEQDPISAKGIEGSVKVSFKDRKRKPLVAALTYVEPVQEEEEGHGHKAEGEHHEQDYLMAEVDLSEVLEGSAKAVFALANLPGEKEKEVTFKETFTLARLLEYACPMKHTEPSDEPGRCEKCGMVLERVSYVFKGPMHNDVASRDKADKCWICGMKLVKAEDGQEEEAGEHGGDEEHGGGHH